jgi:hypothetical protein
MRVSPGSLVLSVVLGTVSATAAVVGINPPAKPLTAQWIRSLPAGEQTAWVQYLERSTRQLRESQEQFTTKLRQAGAAKPFGVIPPSTPARANANSAAIRGAAAWFEKTAIYGESLSGRQNPEARGLVATPGRMWALSRDWDRPTAVWRSRSDHSRPFE